MSAFERPNALVRLLRVPGLIVFAILLHLLPQMFAGSRMANAIEGALGRYALPEGRSFLSGFIELMMDHPSLGPTHANITFTAMIGTLVVWWLILAGVLHHLREPGTGGRILSRGFAGLPRILVVSLWHWPLRLLLVGVPIAIGRKLDMGSSASIGIVLGLIALFYCTSALDLARCQAVLYRSRPYRFGVAWSGFVQALRQPGFLVPSMLLGLAQWAAAVAALGYGLGNLEASGSLWTVRALAALAVVLGLARLSVAVGAGPPGRFVIESKASSE